MGKINLFVYGTLKRGTPQNQLLDGQEFVRPAVTLPHYLLYDLGPFPGLVHQDEQGLRIHGEIWRVDEALLPRLDAWEGAPRFFVRKGIALEDFPDSVLAYFYNGDVSNGRKCTTWPP